MIRLSETKAISRLQKAEIQHWTFLLIIYPINRSVRKETRQNLDKQEKEAMKKLSNNNDIIIKEADKGSAIVIMNKTFYKNKILSMLNNEYYQKMDQNSDNKTMHKLKLILEKESKITKHEYDYITNFEFKTSQFYGLPKIYNSKEIIKAITEQNSEYICVPDPQDLTFRPIVAGPACPTHRISNVIDILLKPFITDVLCEGRFGLFKPFS